MTRAQVFERNGFCHDAGPTVIATPFLFEELFALFGENFSDYVQLVPLTPWYRFHFSDNNTFDYGETLEQTLAEIARIEPRDCDGCRALLAQSKRIFDVGFTGLSAQPFHRFMTMVRQVPRLLVGNPFDTTSIYGLIHYLEREHGVHFAIGGTAATTAALRSLMERQKIEIRVNETVASIQIMDGAATGVVLEAQEVVAGYLVASNPDPAYLCDKMVPSSQQAPLARLKLRAAEFLMGLFVLYFGTTRTCPDVAHHTIWLGERYRELRADIFHHKTLSEDFSLYLYLPTATDSSFAPDCCDSFYVLCPIPNLKGDVDWSVQGTRLVKPIVTALDQTILPGLTESITSNFFMASEDFAQDYLSAHGAVFSVAPLFRQSARFRFNNRAESVKNLHLVGAGTHPGTGVPGVLCSAKVMDAMVLKAGVL